MFIPRRRGGSSTVEARRYGFDPVDATSSITRALASGIANIEIPSMANAPWVVTPLTLVSDRRIEFKPGCTIKAKYLSFMGATDCLISGTGLTNITIRGYGATLLMRKADYI